MKIWMLRAVVTFAVLGLIWLCWAFAQAQNRVPYYGEQWEYLPNYPNAKSVLMTRADLEDNGLFVAPGPYTTMTFDTTDSSASVFEFYKQVFKKRSNDTENWSLNQAEQTDNSLALNAFGPKVGTGPPLFTIIIKTQEVEGNTHVSVERTYFGGF